MTTQILINHQGIKGGDYSKIKEVGYANLYIDEKFHISVDAFSGFGGTYKKREKTLININHEGFSYSCTLENLIEKLKS